MCLAGEPCGAPGVQATGAVGHSPVVEVLRSLQWRNCPRGLLRGSVREGVDSKIGKVRRSRRGPRELMALACVGAGRGLVGGRSTVSRSWGLGGPAGKAVALREAV